MDLNYRGPSINGGLSPSTGGSGSSSSSSGSSGGADRSSSGLSAYLVKGEELAEDLFSKGKKVLPTAGRFLLISTFLEDGLRMWFQWEDQADYFRRQWGVSWLLVSLFLLLNLSSQLTGSFMILLRKRVDIAVIILFSVIVAQTLAYSVLWNFSFFLRNLSMVGSLILLLAEVRQIKKVYTGGLAVETDAEKQHNYMLLTGRILAVIMFFTLLHGTFSFLKIVLTIVGTALIGLVVVGFRTKLSALLLVAFLGVLNLFLNPFWTYNSWDASRDFVKYDFFQTLSVMGALLLLVSIGPGALSVDVRKKAY